MCLLHGLMAELRVKTNIVKVLLCDLVNNSLTPTGGKNNNKISIESLQLKPFGGVCNIFEFLF